jgi:uncharacterized protein (DUF488 family)
MRPGEVVVWTIGHSTRSLREFLELLTENRIELLADIRRFPGSRRYPHFGGEALRDALAAIAIDYRHLGELGGRRRPHPDSHNDLWRNASFRGYADYMETPEFEAGLERLLRLARAERTALMCSEAVWWRCHRALVADALKARGVEVVHILGPDKNEVHPYTAAAQLTDGVLLYHASSHSRPARVVAGAAAKETTHDSD